MDMRIAYRHAGLQIYERGLDLAHGHMLPAHKAAHDEHGRRTYTCLRVYVYTPSGHMYTNNHAMSMREGMYTSMRDYINTPTDVYTHLVQQ
jgi:hypothetical protein